MILYSKSTGGFYDTTISGDNVPSDVIEISTEQHTELLAGQSDGKQIVVDDDGVLNLVGNRDDILDKMWTGIKRARDEYMNGGVFVAGNWFHSDNNSRVKYMGLKSTVPFPENLQWKTMNGTYVTMTVALVQLVLNSISKNDAIVFEVAEKHKMDMQEASDPSAYDYSSEWPSTFGD